MLRSDLISVEGEVWAETVNKLCKHKDICAAKSKSRAGRTHAAFWRTSQTRGFG